MNESIYERVYSRQDRYSGEYTKIVLPPTGLLIGLTIDAKENTRDWSTLRGSEEFQNTGNLEYQITGPAEIALYGRILLPLGKGSDNAGILFPEPLPNVNAACPYILKCPKDGPDILVTMFSGWPTR